MEHYDSDKAARVWQRVRGDAPPVQTPELSELPRLAAEESALAAMYRRMAKQQPGLGTLAQDCARHAAMLRGICVFTGAEPAKQSLSGEAPRDAVRSCYGRNLRAIGEYEKRASHPEYGCVFRALAEKKREHACVLLELVGNRK